MKIVHTFQIIYVVQAVNNGIIYIVTSISGAYQHSNLVLKETSV